MNSHPPLTSPEKRRQRVAIYARARDDEGLRRQREDLERFIAHQSEWAIVAVYEDIARPDKKRPALDRLIADAKNGSIDLVAVRDMSRLGRSIQDFVRNARILDHSGVSIAASAECVDTRTTQGRLVMAVLTAAVDSFRYARHDFPGGAL